MPTHEELDIRLPKKAVFAFLGEHVDNYALLHNATRVGTFVSATRNYPVYIVKYQGEDVCLCQAPVGAAPAVKLLDWLIGYGVREIVSTGSCGALCDFEENVFLIPYRALRDEGTSYHYMPPARYIDIDKTALRAIESSVTAHGLKYREAMTWTTDGFYRETKEMVEYRREEGCELVEMECSALAACAAFRKVKWGCILFTADTLANVEKYDERNWGKDSYDAALELCFEAVINY